MFYNIKMDSYGDTATLQSYTNKFTKVVGELAAQDQEPDVEEVNTIYLQGLAPFFYMIVNYCLTDTRELKKEFAVIVQHVRKHALLPNILQQLKDFDKRAAAQTPASIFFAGIGKAAAKEQCRLFMKGVCKYGEKCKFEHSGEMHSKPAPKHPAAAPGGPSAGVQRKFCVHCRNVGHLKAECRGFEKGHPPNTTKKLPANLEQRTPVHMHPAVAEPQDEEQFYFELSAVAVEDEDYPELLSSSDSESESNDFEQLLSDDQQDVVYQRARREQFAARWRQREGFHDAQDLPAVFVDDVIHSHRHQAAEECKGAALVSIEKATQTEEVIHFSSLALPVSTVDSSTSTEEDYDEYIRHQFYISAAYGGDALQESRDALPQSDRNPFCVHCRNWTNLGPQDRRLHQRSCSHSSSASWSSLCSTRS